jgi:uncharacterized integral membrane protein (TIGR00698 family)
MSVRAPGLVLALAVTLASVALAEIERRFFGAALVDALVVAILFGVLVRAALLSARVAARAEPGVDFATKEVLEFAVLLLGASVDLPALLRAGPALAVGIVLLVSVGLASSYAIGRALKLPHTLAVLVACGNSICGNSAIAAVAPVIGARRDHVAAAIGFTAVLGVIVVVGLPLLMRPLGLSDYQYGVLAGLTIYSVPQVLAAAFPVSATAGQIATLVKLVRVLMLGPVVIFFTLAHRRARAEGAERSILRVTGLLPWFIIGFLVLATLRSLGVIPQTVSDLLKQASHALTLIAMAGLGLGVDLRAVRSAGRAVVLTVCASLATLVALGLLLIHALGID